MAAVNKVQLESCVHTVADRFSADRRSCKVQLPRTRPRHMQHRAREAAERTAKRHRIHGNVTEARATSTCRKQVYLGYLQNTGVEEAGTVKSYRAWGLRVFVLSICDCDCEYVCV